MVALRPVDQLPSMGKSLNQKCVKFIIEIVIPPLGSGRHVGTAKTDRRSANMSIHMSIHVYTHLCTHTHPYAGGVDSLRSECPREATAWDNASSNRDMLVKTA